MQGDAKPEFLSRDKSRIDMRSWYLFAVPGLLVLAQQQSRDCQEVLNSSGMRERGAKSLACSQLSWDCCHLIYGLHYSFVLAVKICLASSSQEASQ